MRAKLSLCGIHSLCVGRKRSNSAHIHQFQWQFSIQKQVTYKCSALHHSTLCVSSDSLKCVDGPMINWPSCQLSFWNQEKIYIFCWIVWLRRLNDFSWNFELYNNTSILSMPILDYYCDEKAILSIYAR